MDDFSVVGGPLDPVRWTMLSATGEEALSSLFAFTLTLAAKREDVDAALATAGSQVLELALLGQKVRFRLGDSGIDRFGIVAAAHAEGTVETGGEPYARVRIHVAPRAWLLTQRRLTRIFPGKYVHEIVSEVLTKAGVRHRWNLGNVYPKRLYCTQYDETDYEFITRLLAEEGILFFFEHALDTAASPPAGGATPEESGWDTAKKVLDGVAKGAGFASKVMFTEQIKFGAAANVVLADFMTSPTKDDEAEDPITPGAGAGGPSAAGDVFVFVDQAVCYGESSQGSDPPGILTIPLREGGGFTPSPWEIHELTPSRRVRADRVEVRDYDFRRPLLLLKANAGSASANGDYGVPLEVYAHHGEYEKPEVTTQLAQVELEQHRADALLSEGQGPCPRLSPGHLFHIKNAAEVRLPHERYAVVRIRHESTNSGFTVAPQNPNAELEGLLSGCARAIHAAATAGSPPPEEELRRIIRQAMAAPSVTERTYWARFECVPSDVAYRPPRPVRAPRHVTEFATVVGPVGQEIYTDRYGRVKVQFHWHREGQWKEDSSCWIRVIQPWAGAGFGSQFIPRVGMEVLVAFVGGDPDRPVVLGSLYNATHATPEPLPQRLTRSGFRSQSSPGGGGFNELSFEDQKGVERVYIHAQKDLHEIVNDTHTLNIKNQQNITVAGTQQISAGSDQRVAVGARRTVTVGGDDAEHVQGSVTTNVVRNRTDFVQGNALTSVGGAAVRTVRADELTVVEGNQNPT